jgi:hypothetical protein
MSNASDTNENTGSDLGKSSASGRSNKNIWIGIGLLLVIVGAVLAAVFSGGTVALVIIAGEKFSGYFLAGVFALGVGVLSLIFGGSFLLKGDQSISVNSYPRREPKSVDKATLERHLGASYSSASGKDFYDLTDVDWGRAKDFLKGMEDGTKYRRSDTGMLHSFITFGNNVYAISRSKQCHIYAPTIRANLKCGISNKLYVGKGAEVKTKLLFDGQQYYVYQASMKHTDDSYVVHHERYDSFNFYSSKRPSGYKRVSQQTFLGRELNHDEPKDQNTLIQVLYQIAQQLKQAHDQGVVHCDLKWANVLYFEDTESPNNSRVSIIDWPEKTHRFGKHVQREEALMISVLPPGSLFTSWSLRRGYNVTPAWDVYQLGKMIQEKNMKNGVECSFLSVLSDRMTKTSANARCSIDDVIECLKKFADKAKIVSSDSPEARDPSAHNPL